MNRALVAALAALLAIGSTVRTVEAVVPEEPGQIHPAPAFDGRVMVRMTPNETSALRAASPRGLARMRTASTVLRGISAAYEVRSMQVALDDQELFSEARAVGLDRWFELEVDPAAGFEAVAAGLRALSGVELVEPALVQGTLHVAPNDSLFAKNWAHGNTGTFSSYSAGTHTGPNVGTVGFDANVQGGWGAPSAYGTASTVIAIFDFGLDSSHPDLRMVAGYDFVYDQPAVRDSNAHGTMCAGIAAGIANNAKGVAGAAGGCSIMPLKAFSDSKASTAQMIVDAIAFAANHGADVMSMSLQMTRTQFIADALTAADAAGVVLIASTGNTNSPFIPFPANHPKVIAVGAASPCGGRKRSTHLQGVAGINPDSLGVSCDGEYWWGSCWGVAVPNDSAAVDLLGPTIMPTTDIQGAAGWDPSGYFDYFDGTSAAAPYVAGVVGLIRSQHPAWTSAQVRQRLVETAIDLSDVQTPVGWDKYTGYGMVNAGLPDLVPYATGGWSAPIVPRAAPDATMGSVPAPTTLNGDVNSYISIGAANFGEATSGSDVLGIYVDAVEAGGGVGYNLGVNYGAYLQNIPWVVRGGRHTVGMVVNKNNNIDESNETNNRNAHQWSWVPTTMPTSVSAVVSRATPPDRNAGRADVPVSETTYDNVDGVRMLGPDIGSTNEFWVMALHGSDDATDLDLNLHTSNSSATGNFTTGNRFLTSQQGAGKTDWGVLNLLLEPYDKFDAASLLVAGTGGARFESRLSGDFASVFSGTSMTIPGVPFASDMMVAVHDLTVIAGGEGGVSLELNSSGPLKMALYDTSLLSANRAQATQLSTQIGTVQGLTRTLVLGRHAIVVYRDRADGTAPLTYSITVRRPTAELIATTAGGAVLDPAGVYKEGVGNKTSLPTVLDGNVNNTRFYYAYSNQGPATASGFTTRELLDGVDVNTWIPGPLLAGAGIHWVSPLRTVRGGRHTVGFINDFANTIDEFNETDNNWAVSKVWSALPLTMEVPVSRLAPPDPSGGWAQIPVAVTRFNNVDGLKTPVLNPVGANGFWNFFALVPRTASDDVDLAVYEPYSVGPGNGFTTADATSTLPAGRVDYVGIDSYAPRAVDLGVIKAGAAAGSVVVHGTASIHLASESGTYGPFTLDPDELIACFDVYASGVPLQIKLINQSGNANLDLHVFQRYDDDPFTVRLPGDGVHAPSAGDGANEVLQLTHQGFPGIVVTKNGTGDLIKTATFSIEISPSAVDVGDDGMLPTAVQLAPVVPNPVQGAAAIAFELPRAGTVQLAAYDVTGRHVATIASGSWEAGRHAVTWTPGARLASGVYLLRLEADGAESVRRVVLTH